MDLGLSDPGDTSTVETSGQSPVRTIEPARLDLTYSGNGTYVSVNLIELCKHLFKKED